MTVTESILLLILAALVIGLLTALIYAGTRIEFLHMVIEGKDAEYRGKDHRVYVDAMWTTVRAQVLRDAAEAWPTVDAEAERKRLSWTSHPTEGGSMVVVWLNSRADKIEKGIVHEASNEPAK